MLLAVLLAVLELLLVISFCLCYHHRCYCYFRDTAAAAVEPKRMDNAPMYSPYSRNILCPTHKYL
jgi:hypothetical protein